jgi:hypothetical protein
MALGLNLSRLILDFEICGVAQEEDGYFMEPFRRGMDYYGFVVKRKKG